MYVRVRQTYKTPSAVKGREWEENKEAKGRGKGKGKGK